MNVQNHVGYVSSSVDGFQRKKQLARRKLVNLPGGSVLWIASLKMSCLVLILTLSVGLFLGYEVKQANLALQEVEAQQHIIRNDQMALLAERAVLMSAQHVQREAGRELALFVPEEDQVFRVR